MSRYRPVVLLASLIMLAPAPRSASAEECCDDGRGSRVVTPTRLVDTRDAGPTVDGEHSGGGRLVAASRLDVKVAGRGDVPVDAAAVALNVTAIAPTAAGFITVWPTGASQPATSNLNTSPLQTVPNMVLVPIGDDGQVSFALSTGATDLAVDVLAWFPPGGDVTALEPARLADTRPNGVTVDGLEQGSGIVGSDEVLTIDVAGRGGVPATAGGVAINVTAVAPTSSSYLTVWPAGAARPVASNLNTAPGRTLPNTVIVPIGAGGRIALHNAVGDVHVVVDVLGWFVAGGDASGIVPARLADTRSRGITVDGLHTGAGALGAGDVLDIVVADRGGVPLSAGAVALNVTAVAPTTSGYLTVWPSDEPRPHASSLNTAPGRTLPNLVVVPVGENGSVSVYNAFGSTHVVVDVLGWFDQPGRAKTTRIVSIRSDGGPADDDSVAADVSADGRFVAFTSVADNLVDDDLDGFADVFVRDMRTGTTEMVSRDSAGAQFTGWDSSASISDDGRYVAMAVEPRDESERMLVIRDRVSRTSRIVDVDGDGDSSTVAPVDQLDLSADGRFVAFVTTADLGLPGEGPEPDAYVHDLRLGTTALVSVALDGQTPAAASEDPSVSADGRLVTFASAASNLVAGDTNASTDVFVRDLVDGSTRRVSVASGGAQGTHPSTRPSMSADGRFVAFESGSVLSPADHNAQTADIYVHDLDTGQTSLASVDSLGAGGAGPSHRPSISGDGRFVAFESFSTFLVEGNTGDVGDIFVHDRLLGRTTLVSVTVAGGSPGSDSERPAISSDGRFVVWRSGSDELVEGDFNESVDIFEHGVWR